jgi:hypothetical protein
MLRVFSDPVSPCSDRNLASKPPSDIMLFITDATLLIASRATRTRSFQVTRPRQLPPKSAPGNGYSHF